MVSETAISSYLPVHISPLVHRAEEFAPTEDEKW